MWCLLTVLALSTPAQEREPAIGHGPQPSPTTISWELEFRFLDPHRIEVQLPGRREPEAYWYMVYTVKNTSGRTQRFYPTAQLVTEELHVIDTDMGINPLVFEAIKEQHKVTHPYLVHPTKAIGDLRAGEDYARESVFIWRPLDVKVNNFTVYVAGLSGETRYVPNPAHDPDSPETIQVTGPDGRGREVAVNPKYFTLRKTLEIRYTLPGSPSTREHAQPERERVRWIMR
jgi:hypothetical protein